MERNANVIDFHKHTVFDRDPFAIEPLPKAHYFPSPERKVQARQRYIISQAPLEKKLEQQYEEDRLSPMDELFLKGSNVYQSRNIMHDTENPDETNFDESWPTSEKPSSLSLSGLEDDSPLDIHKYQATMDKVDAFRKTLKTTGKENQKSSCQRLRKPGSSPQSLGVGKGRKTDSSSSSKIQTKASKTNRRLADVEEKKKAASSQEQPSVLQRYIERFRNSAPMSREEREKQHDNSSKDFWWMSDKDEALHKPSSSSIARDTEKATKPPLTEENLLNYTSTYGKKNLHYKDWTNSLDHKKTAELQERAETVLERSSSTVVSTDPAVSTEGLGSNMSDMSSIEDYSYKPSFARYIEREKIPNQIKHAAGPVNVAYPTVHPVRVEDDPLHQWRLRRRMEQAKEAGPVSTENFGFYTKTEQQKKIDAKLEEFKQRLAGKEVVVQPSHTPLQSQALSVDQSRNLDISQPPRQLYHTGKQQFTPAPTQNKEDDRIRPNPDIASPTLHRRKVGSQPAQTVDPHLHLMCDLLPCPHQNEYKEQYGAKDDSEDSLKTSNNYKQYLEAEKPDIENESKDNRLTENLRDINPKTRQTEPRKYTRKEQLDKHEKESVDDLANKENHDDFEEGKGHKSKKITDLQNDIYHEKGSVAQRDSRREEQRSNVIKPTHSSSPKIGRKTIDSAIGQVVKDHLFSTTTSTVLSSVDSLPPTASVDRLQQKQNKLKESQEIDEEYMSDGEFPDDHLLQMLRKQRSLYEHHLHQIDQKLKTIEDR